MKTNSTANFIVEVLWAALQHWRKPTYYPSVTDKFPVGAEQSYLKRNRFRGAGYAAYIRWLRQAGIEQHTSPIELLTKALNSHPSFDEWYSKFN